ncbi:hypothetical protein LN042_00265 [Kitasatospora sp. RB6PN24]|uniref:hypothetical protein n=1 Tax=Kitasatospora humi TaxID=2893891 RepID=UPI001E459149|nr:hypothetical protein [Kitasatospora humi]MCC9305563.1 hypothetical protein [Kitasatospora humi]
MATEENAHWLDDDLPRVRRWTRPARGESVPAGPARGESDPAGPARGESVPAGPARGESDRNEQPEEAR